MSVKALRYRSRPHLVAFTFWESREMLIQVPEPFRPFREMVDLGSRGYPLVPFRTRRDVIHDMRELKKEGDAGSDEEHHGETELQKATDAASGEIDSLLKGKEEEILEV